MNAVGNTLLATILGLVALSLSTAGASAAIACAADTCWHVHNTYHYPRAAHVVIHPNGWHWGPKVVIRDHEGRGYWRGDHWVEW